VEILDIFRVARTVLRRKEALIFIGPRTQRRP
jgi:hypothetical protein